MHTTVSRFGAGEARRPGGQHPAGMRWGGTTLRSERATRPLASSRAHLRSGGVQLWRPLAVALTGLACALALLAGSAQAETRPNRVALIIGNAHYALGTLKNPVNDARSLSATLQQAGFKVQLVEDADRATMQKVIEGMKWMAGPDTTGLVYFAGHGVQFGSADFLLPTDIKIDSPEALADNAVSADWVLSQMYLAGFRFNILVLDACRNSPFGDEITGITSGLAPVGFSPDVETLVAYSTAPGELAADGEGANSPYAAALISALAFPERDIFDVFRAVRANVREATEGRQLPWVAGSLEHRFYFHEDRSVATTVGQEPERDLTAEEVYWDEIAPSRNPADFDQFLVLFPDSARLEEAKERRRNLLTEGVQPIAVPELDLPSAPDDSANLAALVTPCDAVAADPDDPARLRPGIPSGVVNSHLAIRLCAAALAAHPDNARLAFQLGRALDIAQDYDTARHFYRQAAERNYSAALTNLGFMYRTGRGVAQDYASARQFYLASAEFGNLRARTNLGKMFEEGWGVDSDLGAARLWYELAASSGWANALDSLGNLYRQGKGVPKDAAEAQRLYLLAADLGQNNAMNNLGVMYRDGIGVLADPRQAVAWFTRAMDHGNTYAPFHLGNLLRDGVLVEADPARALRLFGLAADRGHAEARLSLAEMSLLDKRVPFSPDTAYFHAKLAADLGSPKIEARAEQILSVLRLQLPKAKIADAEKQAADWLTQNGE